MFKGSYVALVTPMTNDDDVDYQALDRLLDFHLQAGTDGLVLLGSTGEGSSLSLEERTHFIGHSLDYVQGRLPIIVGVGSNSTKMSIVAAQAVAEQGVAGLLVICPYYNRPTQEGIYQHFNALNDAVDVPIILYNHPGRTGADMQPETVARLAILKNIVGIKEAVIEVSRFTALQAIASSEFSLYSGDDETCLDFIKYGACGVISVVANIIPAAMHDVIAMALDNNLKGAEALLQDNMPLIVATNFESNPIPVKWALAKMGLMRDGIRLPLTRLTEPYQIKFEKILQTSGLLTKDTSNVKTA